MNLITDLKIIICEYLDHDCKDAVQYLFGKEYTKYSYLYEWYATDDTYYDFFDVTGGNSKKICYKHVFTEYSSIRYLLAHNTKDIHKYNKLIKLVFTDNFNTSICNIIFPSSITFLQFGDSFNQPLDNLYKMSNLVVLRTGRKYDQEIKKNMLPESLKYLSLGSDFSKPIEKNVLPRLLKQLYLYKHYKQSFRNIIDEGFKWFDSDDKYIWTRKSNS